MGVGVVLCAGLFFLSFFAAAESVATRAGQWVFGAGGVTLGLLTTWGTVRHLNGKRWKYVDEPDETASGYQLLGIVHRLDAKHLIQLSAVDWERIKRFRPRASSKKSTRLPTEPLSEKARVTLMRMTPKKQRLVERMERWQRWSLYPMPLALLTFFTNGLFFVFWLWFFAGLWLTLEAIIGLIHQRIGVFSETTTLDIYGWPARVFAVLVLIIALLVFLIPGILGMSSALEVDIIDRLFSSP